MVTQKPGKPKRKDTQVPQPSDPSEYVTDEVVHKELGDSLVRAATTASSLEAEQDNGNITNTRSKATPNESSSLGTTLGGGPKCQETMRDTIAQTRFENVSKLSNDSLLARGNTLQSDEDRLKLNDLMELCTNLQKRVLDLEKTKTTQANEITFLKRRVKKLENKDRSRTHKLKRLYKVGFSAREESSRDENCCSVIRLDEEIASKLQAEFDEEVRLAREKAEKEQEANVALTEEWDDIQAKIKADHELAQRLQAQEQEELSDAEKATLFVQLLEKRRKHFAAKRAEEKRNKPPTQAQQRKIMCTYLKNMEGKKPKDLKNKSFDSIQKMFDRAFKRVNTFVDFRTDLVEGSSKRAGEELEQESSKKQKSTKASTIDELEDPQKEGKKSYYQIIRADGKSQMYKVFSQMLKSFSRKDLEDLYKLVKAKYGSTRPMEDLDLILCGDLKTMFEPHVKDQVWKNQDDYKVLD
ncbi:hypothetical protein Tco_1532356 [Tanacetum coccineum]